MGLCSFLAPWSFWVIISLYSSLLFVHVSWAEKRGGYHYHALDITARLREVSSPPLEPYKTHEEEEEVGKNPWRLQVFHRDSLVGGNVSYEKRFKERLERESRRVKALNRQVERKLKGSKKKGTRVENKVEIEDFGGEVTSGMMVGSGEYFTRIGVGTPAREQYLVLDTGSDVIWVQCLPCKDCYDQTDPVFDPSSSASFTSISCGSEVCSELEEPDCNSLGCAYRVDYGDGSHSIGSFSTETLTFGNTRVQNVAIGCGHDNQGLFVGAAGLIGLGAGALSFPSQIRSYVTRFSYCLVDRSSQSSGVVDFGPGSVSPIGSVFVPLLRNPRFSTFYYVPLTAIGVGGLLVSLPQKVFEFDLAGEGGVIVDSGTAVTRLQRDAYEAVRDAFVVSTQHLPRAEGISMFDTCYDFAGLLTVSVPTVSFRFLNGAILTLPAENYLIPVDVMGTFCLAFAPTEGSLSIIGNIQQQGVRVSIDSVNSVVGFGINQC